MASEGLHEAAELLDQETVDHHRAITSLVEELEAVDWYDQRVDAATDPELKEILAHNRDEEKEHFVMLLEWYRRRDAKMAAQLKDRLFTAGSIVAQEQAEKAGGGAGAESSAGGDGSLGVGSLRGGGEL